MKNPEDARYSRITLGVQVSEGSFAEIYEGVAHLPGQKENVAIKVLKEKWADNQEIMDRFSDEAHVLMALQHPNIMSVMELVTIKDRPAVVMEMIRGTDLKALIGRKPPPAVSFSIVQLIAEGLHAAYALPPPGQQEAMEVVHRDIKPSNIMLSRRGEVKIVDFGASRFEDSARLSETNLFQFGSPKYMPSERRLGDRGGHKSDMYSLGIVLLELLQGVELPEVPPTDHREHAAYFSRRIAELEYGLPNAEWESSAEDLLKRLCAYHPEHRLSAAQSIPLLKAFSEQAKGGELPDFARKHIPQLMLSQSSSNAPGPLTGHSHGEPAAKAGLTRKATPLNAFLVATAASAFMTFFFFSAITLAGLKLVEKKSPVEKTASSIDEKAVDATKAPEKQVDVLLTMSKDDFRKAIIRDGYGAIVLESRASSPENTAALAPGDYTLEVQGRFSRNKKKAELSIATPQEIHCEMREEVVGCWNQSKRNLISLE